MPQDRPIAVELEIDEARPLSGRLREQGAPWRGFAGWIGLAGAIDGVLAQHPVPDAPADDPARGLGAAGPPDAGGEAPPAAAR